MTSLLSCALSGMTSVKEVKESQRKIFHVGSCAYGRLHNVGLIGFTQFISRSVTVHTCVLINMSLMCNHGKARFPYGIERRRPASDNAAYDHKQERDTLKQAVSELMDRVNQGEYASSYVYNYILKRCAIERDLESVKQVHDLVKDSEMEQHPYVGTMLLKCYIECGRMEAAEETLNKLLTKGTVIWTTMIAGHVKHDQADGAIKVYKQMRDEGGQADIATYLSVLKACASPSTLNWGEKIHADIVRDGLQGDVRIGSSLVAMYAKCGSIEDALAVFGKMGRRDVVSWNVMIGALAEHGLGHEAFSLFLQMQREGFTPDAVTYVNIFNPASSTGAIEWVREVHAHAMKAGFDVDVRVQNVSIQMYAKSGSIEFARAVFGKMGRRDVVTWNVMIGALAEHGLGLEAVSLFLQMQREGFTPDAITYMNILNPSSSTGAIEWVRVVQDHATRARFDVDVRVQNAFIQMYAKSGYIENAREVFSKMGRRDVVSWNVMIGAVAEHGLGHEAFSLFLQMQREGFTPNAITYMNILNPSSSTGAIEWVREVYAHATRAGFDVDVRVQCSFIQMYAKSGSMEQTRAVFGKMGRHDVGSWNAMIGALAEHGLGHEAFSLFIQMQREGVTPVAITYMSILNPASSTGALEWVREVQAHARRAGFDVDVRVQNALIQMYAKSGSMEDARAVFGKMGMRDVFSWNAMIGAFAERGLGHKAFSLFVQMRREGYSPDAITYMNTLNPSSSTGALEWVKEVHAHATRSGLDLDVRVQNALIQMYAKSGSVEDARAVFGKMRNPDLLSYTMMIAGLAQHGHGREVLQLYKRMKSEGLKPDNVVFVAVLSACSHAGLVEEGIWLFDSMRRDYGIVPEMEHYTCVVDLLGRAGRLKEAEFFIINMPIKPDFVTWLTLLGACKNHNSVQLAEIAAEECMKMNSTDPATYVLLSNLYAALGNRDEVTRIRSMMRRRGVRKEPGRSWIEINNKVHQFQVGVAPHPETREIQATLSRLSKSLKAEGYVPDTRLVLRDIAEEDKESAICSHSEKLAIAYGLMHVPPGKPIRVFKNLRICTDCHTASKLISRFAGREIVARDVKRFHHFKDGSCSCDDYW